jgi:hypothetical protein
VIGDLASDAVVAGLGASAVLFGVVFVACAAASVELLVNRHIDAELTLSMGGGAGVSFHSSTSAQVLRERSWASVRRVLTSCSIHYFIFCAGRLNKVLRFDREHRRPRLSIQILWLSVIYFYNLNMLFTEAVCFV